MAPLTNINTPIKPQEFKKKLYAGAILKMGHLEKLSYLLQNLKNKIQSTFPESDPRKVHNSLTEEEFCSRTDSLRAEVSKDDLLRQCLRDLLCEIGLEAETTGVDALILRIQAPHHFVASNTLSPHRDTWGSRQQSQINWWAPIYPVTKERTMRIFPDFFDKAVPNTSEGWDWKELKNLEFDEKKNENNLLPLALGNFSQEKKLPLTPNVGEIMAFSGAHLHESVPNTTDEIRYSLETRTFDLQDEKRGEGAPNLDGKSVRSGQSWFRLLSNDQRMKSIRIKS